MSVKAGVADTNKYYGMTAVFVDIDDDGKPDLLVANDSTPNYFYRNQGNGTFQDESYLSGFAFNKDGHEVAGMGVAVGDYLNSGKLGIFVTDFADDSKVLYRNDGDASLTDVSHRSGIGETSIPFLSWGTDFLDFDNDGWKDIFIVSGHVFPVADKSDWGSTYAQKVLLYRNVHDGKFEIVPAVKGTGLAAITSARGAAFGDLFNDGKIDVIISPIDGPVVLLRNVNPDHHHWVELELTGGPKSPRDAVGAVVFLAANGMRQRENVLSSGSYISSNDKRAHFGLGDATDAGTAEIRWPSGGKETVKLGGVDRVYRITEGKGITAELCSGAACPVTQPSPAAESPR